MKGYMVLALCLLTLCLLTLTACGSKAAQDAEETPGDPTGSVRVVPAQGEALPTEGASSMYIPSRMAMVAQLAH